MSIWPEWANIGSKVVLIDGRGCLSSDKTHLEGEIFVIIERSDDFAEPAVRTRNLVTGAGNPPWEFGRLSRYRPLHTLRSDIRRIKSALRDLPASERLDRLAELLNTAEGG